MCAGASGLGEGEVALAAAAARQLAAQASQAGAVLPLAVGADDEEVALLGPGVRGGALWPGRGLARGPLPQGVHLGGGRLFVLQPAKPRLEVGVALA